MGVVVVARSSSSSSGSWSVKDYVVYLTAIALTVSTAADLLELSTTWSAWTDSFLSWLSSTLVLGLPVWLVLVLVLVAAYIHEHRVHGRGGS